MDIKWANSRLPPHIQASIDGEEADLSDQEVEFVHSDQDQLDDQFLDALMDSGPTTNQGESVINEALKRIEQANLYQTLINHTLFGPNSARPEIIEHVTNEIRAFAIERLENLLGMRSETKAQAVHIQEQFTEEEAAALRAIAARLLVKPEAPKERNPSVNVVGTQKPVTPSIRQVSPEQPATPTVAAPVAPKVTAPPKTKSRTKKSGSQKDPNRNYAQAGNPNAMTMPRDIVINQPNMSQGVISNGVNLTGAILDALKK